MTKTKTNLKDDINVDPNPVDKIEPNAYYHIKAKNTTVPTLTQFGSVIIEQSKTSRWNDFFNSGFLTDGVLYQVFKVNPKSPENMEFIWDQRATNILKNNLSDSNATNNNNPLFQSSRNDSPLFQYNNRAMSESFQNIHQQTATVLGDQLAMQNQIINGLRDDVRYMNSSRDEILKQHQDEMKTLRDQFYKEKDDLTRQLTTKDIRIADLERRIENLQFQNDLDKRFTEKAHKLDAKIAESESSTMKDLMQLAPFIMPAIMGNNVAAASAAPAAVAAAAPLADATPQQKEVYSQQFPGNAEPSDYSYID